MFEYNYPSWVLKCVFSLYFLVVLTIVTLFSFPLKYGVCVFFCLKNRLGHCFFLFQIKQVSVPWYNYK